MPPRASLVLKTSPSLTGSGVPATTPPAGAGWRPRGGKIQADLATDYLDEALADFSGYLAADEVYDGPFCILSVVDNRRQRRLACRVLDHDPTHDDIRSFLGEFKAQL